MKKTSIEIAITCTWFQKRLCWMLSSILQQKGNIPDIVINIGYPENNGNPSTEEVISFFTKQGLQIRKLGYHGMSKIQYRGLVRNDQIKQSSCEWILFADSDMTYHPYFFEDLNKKLVSDLKDVDNIISASRVSLDKEYCKTFFNNQDIHNYPCIVEKAGELGKWPVFQISRNCGAGYFQLVNKNSIIANNNGLYVNPEECKDWSWIEGKTRGQKAKSDVQFRKAMKGIYKIKTLPQYHLNHERDNEVGYHLELQR